MSFRLAVSAEAFDLVIKSSIVNCMDSLSLLGSTLGIGLVSGFNLYATILTLGLGIRLGLIHPDIDQSQIDVLTNSYVLISAGAIFVVEFIADKIPWVDSLWDSLHTFIRPVGAALLGGLVGDFNDPTTRTLIMLLCGGVGLSGHSAKAGTRIAANHSPEPFTNIALSLSEDAFAIGGTWLSLTHPVVMLIIVLMFLFFFFLLSPRIYRLIKLELVAVNALFRKYLVPADSYNMAASTGETIPVSTRAEAPGIIAPMPEPYVRYWQKKFGQQQVLFRCRCAAGKGVPGLRNSIGYLNLTGGGIIFITKKLFRFREQQIGLTGIRDSQLKKGLLLDKLTFKSGDKLQSFLFFKSRSDDGRVFLSLLEELTRSRH